MQVVWTASTAGGGAQEHGPSLPNVARHPHEGDSSRGRAERSAVGSTAHDPESRARRGRNGTNGFNGSTRPTDSHGIADLGGGTMVRFRHRAVGAFSVALALLALAA